MGDRPRLWPVFVAWVGAFVAVIALSILAALVVRGAHPDVPDRAVLEGLPGLLAGGIASSTALVLTVLVAARPLEPARLRLVPGWESGRGLAVMILGMLALGQALDSFTMLLGLGNSGSMPVIRQALTGAAGGELFLAVVVLGGMAGAAEEVFFRGYMQTSLRVRWRPAVTVLVTSACFGVLHLELLHGAMAFVIGLYLGFVTERAGSALPAVACHVVNNAVFTVVTALAGTVDGVTLNAVLLAVAAPVFAACLLRLRRAV